MVKLLSNILIILVYLVDYRWTDDLRLLGRPGIMSYLYRHCNLSNLYKMLPATSKRYLGLRQKDASGYMKKSNN
jgi:hypothetical protein